LQNDWFPSPQSFPPKVDGSISQFRTADDLIGEAAKHISSSSETDNNRVLQVQDIIEFFSLSCTTEALTRLCDMKGLQRNLSPSNVPETPIEISSEIMVYRYSQRKFVEYLRTKVAHLQKCSAFDESQTLTRSLAKEGLMEDGKEDLLNRTLWLFFICYSLAHNFQSCPHPCLL